MRPHPRSGRGSGLLLVLSTIALPAPPVRAAAGTSSTLVVPIVLSSHGAGDSFYVSEMTLTSRGTVDAEVSFSCVPAFGGGSGAASDTLKAGRSLRKGSPCAHP